jgi:hypothetical protein
VVRKRDDEEVYSGGGEEEAGWRGLNRVGSSVVGLGRFSAVWLGRLSLCWTYTYAQHIYNIYIVYI